MPSTQAAGGRVSISGRELRHLRTLRFAPGDVLVVFDEQGAEHEVRLERVGGREASASIVTTTRPAREATVRLVLAPALLKGPKMDLVVEKATEIGVARIAPVRSRYTIGAGHPERWQRIALAAAKQSGRTAVPAVDAPVPLTDLVRAPWPGVRLIYWEGERSARLATLPPGAEAAIVVVGPEGGFAKDEVEDACAHGFNVLGLAPRILRAETAALVAATLCLHRWGDLG
ncbi:MAG TPA: RsmE family RNA methyltransferase [Solirubrobacteraceae bacterium]